ncbi:MAG: hypothetical protein IPJ98_31485 [Bryobacterales bacterium]|nr:hypothetical protein [Bryobacterales bacterium]
MRTVLRPLSQAALVTLGALAWTILTVLCAKFLHVRRGTNDLELTSPALWAMVIGLLLWIAHAVSATRKADLTLPTKIVAWLVLLPMAFLMLMALAFIHFP